MSALYRTFRPLTFQEVVGQEHVKEPLLRAIREGRLAQAYLFSGPRGVGKTTTARLLAMAVGCQGPERPCGVCSHCQAVQKGAHPDVVEIDAASNNSVEDVRELRERILLAPLTAPKKVFILDEAHMLSKSAFNALLKTLEEPPPHVLFVFATTEPERMPPTILSRVQHYRFRRLREEEIALKLRRILEEMGREAEEEALLLIARLSDGAMRDAESLLERLLLLEGSLTRTQVEAALGLPPEDQIVEALDRMLAGEVRKGMETFRKLYREGFSAPTLLRKALEVLQKGAYEVSPEEAFRKLSLASALEEGLSRVTRTPDLLSLEGAFLKGIYERLLAQSLPKPSSLKAEEPPPPPPQPREEAHGRKVADWVTRRRETPNKTRPPEAPKGPSAKEVLLRGPELIEAIVANMGERRKFKALLNNALKGEISFDGKTLRIFFPPGFSGNAQKLNTYLGEIEAALQKAFGSKLQEKPQIVIGTIEGEVSKGRRAPEPQEPLLRPRLQKGEEASEPPPRAHPITKPRGETGRPLDEIAAVHGQLKRTFGKVALLGVRPKRDRLVEEKDEGVVEDPMEGQEEG